MMSVGPLHNHTLELIQQPIELVHLIVHIEFDPGMAEKLEGGGGGV